ncbi:MULTISPECIES: helix-turn-helix domain-containing protein [Streptomyces]|uniref:Helix-turn-helix transcriptional regulator n=2 Tax=Streptomyces TaxID=1883 RepID=A0ABU2U3I9_9ACTN|nr:MULTISPECIES: helix-turn-helix transcriptional regulator [Streptomyces]MDT0467622.1 helix-turn-helix transcriptional regulator [Streptomyces sp. DSM 41699]UXY23377.1 helix-turn-helix domain-containing protein [Streptomyces cynarae]
MLTLCIAGDEGEAQRATAEDKGRRGDWNSLRAVRTARGMALRTVAQRSGLDPGHLSKAERGEKQLSTDSLYRLAVVLALRELPQLLKPYIPERESA